MRFRFMTRTLHIVISCFLAIATLVGSSGFSLHKMACLESGKVSLSVHSDFCCATDELPLNSINAVCCNFDHVDFSVSSFDVNPNNTPLFVLPPVEVITTWIYVPVELESILYEKLIPPLPVGEMLSLICVYII